MPHKTRFAVVAIMLSAVLSFWNLGGMEIQPYDEGYYALSVKAVLQSGAWLDQTDYAIGRFYSASHPPLQIWLMAISAKLFGLSEFALRLPSSIAFIGLITTMFFLARRISDNAALFAVIITGFSPMLVWFARLGQFDMLVTWLSALQILFYIRFLESSKFTDATLAGVMLGLALLTKVLVGGFATVAIVLHNLYRLGSKELKISSFLISNLLFIGLGLFIGFSWFAWMCATHDGFLNRYIDFFITNRVQENQTAANYRTGIFYYANLAVTRIPLSALALAWIVMFFTRREFRTSLRLLWLIALLVPFTILSIAQTKLLWYALLFMPALVFIISDFFEVSLKNPTEKHAQWGFALIGLSCVWSATQSFHRSLLVAPDAGKILLMLGAAVVCVIGLMWISKRLYFEMIFYASVFLLGVGFTTNTAMNGLPFVQTYSGAKEMSIVVDSIAPKSIVHIVSESRFSKKTFNPQFSYYFNGIDVDSSRWQSTMGYRCVSINATAGSLPMFLDKTPSALVLVEKTATNSDNGTVLTDELASRSDVLRLEKIHERGNYVLYRQKK